MSDPLNQPCPYCELGGFAWDLSLHVPDSHGVGINLTSCHCPFCEEKVICSESGTTSFGFEGKWREHYSKCTAYAAAMLSGVKLHA